MGIPKSERAQEGRRATRHRPVNILIYTEGGTFGLGHVKRQAVLAGELRRRGMQITFAHPETERVGWRILEKLHYSVVTATEMPLADALIVDVEAYPGCEQFQVWRSRYPSVVLFGGAAYPPIGHHDLVDLEVYQGELWDNPATHTALNGPQYLVIDPAYRDCQPSVDGHILISMGGRDPFNFTPIAMQAAQSFDRRMVTIWGPQFDAQPTLGSVLSPVSLAPYLEGAALCLCATGMTAYEALCAGVPCVLGNISSNHERTARGLQERGLAINLGQPGEFTLEGCTQAIAYFLKDNISIWPQISKKARALVDGYGLERVAEKIEWRLSSVSAVA